MRNWEGFGDNNCHLF